MSDVPPTFPSVKPNHKAIAAYYETLGAFSAQGVGHELAIRAAFQNLLADTAKARSWTLIPELTIKGRDGRSVRPDGTLQDDAWHLHRGYWEAKDTADNLDAEIGRKIKAGYPLSNTIFEDSRHGVLYQNGREAFRADLRDKNQLALLLNHFYTHTEREIVEFTGN